MAHLKLSIQVMTHLISGTRQTENFTKKKILKKLVYIRETLKEKHHSLNGQMLILATVYFSTLQFKEFD